MSSYQRLLVTTDLSKDCEFILAKAVEVARTTQAELHVLHVAPSDRVGMGQVIKDNHYFSKASLSVEMDYIDQVKSLLIDWVARYEIASDRIHVHTGTVKKVVNEYVELMAIDLVVLGVHNRYGLKLLLGSNSDQLLHSVSCDILAVRIPS